MVVATIGLTNSVESSHVPIGKQGLVLVSDLSYFYPGNNGLGHQTYMLSKLLHIATARSPVHIHGMMKIGIRPHQI